MTLELAEFGEPFIISIINGYDIVPTLSVSSVHDFISEVFKLLDGLISKYYIKLIA